MPPAAAPDGDRIVTVLRDTVPAAQHADTFAVLNRWTMHPRHPHWSLPWLAADPYRQHAGLGSELLARGLAHVDADHLPSYLETPNPRTLPFTSVTASK